MKLCNTGTHAAKRDHNIAAEHGRRVQEIPNQQQCMLMTPR